MTAQIKPIKLWTQAGERAPGINPGKVAIVLRELGLPYEEIPFPIADVKTPEYLAINPNGRLPGTYSLPGVAWLGS
jgi:glutathione S-transferase